MFLEAVEDLFGGLMPNERLSFQAAIYAFKSAVSAAIDSRGARLYLDTLALTVMTGHVVPGGTVLVVRG